MSLRPNISENVARACADLRMGGVVVLTEGPKTALVCAAELVGAARLEDLRDLRGEIDIAVTNWRADTLCARAYDGDLARIVVPGDADAEWVRATADPSADLKYPMKGPYQSRREGSPVLHRAAILLCKQARLLPSAIVVQPQDPDAAMLLAAGGLVRVDVSDIESAQAKPIRLEEVIHARVPLAVFEDAQVRVFRPDDGGEEHYAIEVGQPPRSKPVLARLHSACFTGDLLGSLKCDCGAQLRGALEHMGAEGSGVLLYLNQEGRGIGLANKLRAYALQDLGFDTVEANHRLGFEDDERDFRIGAAMLQAMGFSSLRLMTNNPAKVERMNTCGMTVTERVPLLVGRTKQNAAYLDTKKTKSGHLL